MSERTRPLYHVEREAEIRALAPQLTTTAMRQWHDRLPLDPALHPWRPVDSLHIARLHHRVFMPLVSLCLRRTMDNTEVFLRARASTDGTELSYMADAQLMWCAARGGSFDLMAYGEIAPRYNPNPAIVTVCSDSRLTVDTAEHILFGMAETMKTASPDNG